MLCWRCQALQCLPEGSAEAGAAAAGNGPKSLGSNHINRITWPGPFKSLTHISCRLHLPGHLYTLLLSGCGLPGSVRDEQALPNTHMSCGLLLLLLLVLLLLLLTLTLRCQLRSCVYVVLF